MDLKIFTCWPHEGWSEGPFLSKQRSKVDLNIYVRFFSFLVLNFVDLAEVQCDARRKVELTLAAKHLTICIHNHLFEMGVLFYLC
jgi:hypothetical protein